MFSKSVCIALLALSLSSFTALGAPAPHLNEQEENCQSVQTVFQTVTVTASSASSTSKSSGSSSGSSNNSGSSSSHNSGGSSSHNSGHSSGSSSSGKGSSNNNSSSGSSSSSSSKGGSSNNNSSSGSSSSNNSGSSSDTTTAAASSTTTAASNNDSSSSTVTTNAAAASSTADADAQTSLTLDPSVIATGFEQDGQNPPVAGQTASLTSSNNFINFCIGQTITNGLQLTNGSCNPTPIGQIPSTQNMPSSKFTFPNNFGTIAANTPFNITLAVNNFVTGLFTNAQKNYFAAPQQLNSNGQILGHTHVVVEAISSLTDTTPTDPKVFAFFKGIDAPAVNGIASADVTAGLPEGTYRLCSINTAENHQPVIVPIAQHGFLDDCVYFTASSSGANDTSSAAVSASAVSTAVDASSSVDATATAASSVAVASGTAVVSSADVSGTAVASSAAVSATAVASSADVSATAVVSSAAVSATAASSAAVDTASAAASSAAVSSAAVASVDTASSAATASAASAVKSASAQKKSRRFNRL